MAERLIVELTCLYCGGTIHFCESLDTFTKNLQGAAPTVFLGVPRIWQKFKEGVEKKFPPKKLSLFLSIPIFGGIVAKKIRAALGLTHAKYAITGAAPIPKSIILWYKQLGINIQEGYGLTENLAYSHFNRIGKIRIGSVGQPFPEVDVKIGDGDEILVKSPGTMMGYYKNEEATKEALPDEYLRTGDQGRIDEDGYLYITGRVKDLFKTSKGKYVAPVPIEEKYVSTELFDQVVVLDSGTGQPMAIVRFKQEVGTRSASELEAELEKIRTSINKSLEHYECVSKIAVIKDEWAIDNGFLTPTMKLKRNVVEKFYRDSIDKWNQSDRKIIL